MSGPIATAVTRPFGPMAQFGPSVHWLEATALGQPRVARTRWTQVDAIEAYEQKRWPLGKIPGGKG